MSKRESTHALLSQLADELAARRQAILDAWRDRVDADATLDAASDWSLRQFNDYFPDVLDALGRALPAWPATPPALVHDEYGQAVAHARTRWVQGYSLAGVVREWGHFNAAVLDAVATLAVDPVDAAVARVALEVWSRVLNDQQSLSAREYHLLEQAEAETRGAELARALESLRSGSLMRGRAMERLASTMRNDLQLVMTTSTLAQDERNWQETYELRTLSEDGFRGLEQALSDMVTLAHLEAGHETRSIQPFDAAPGLALLVEGLQHVAAQSGAVLAADGPEHLRVEGDVERVRRVARHLLSCALRAPQAREVRVHWDACADSDARWQLVVEHPLAATAQARPCGSGHALAVASSAADAHDGRPADAQDPALQSGAAPVAEGDGVDLLIAKHLCDLLDGGLRIDADAGWLRYRVTLPTHYRPRPEIPPQLRPAMHDPTAFRG